MEAWRGLHCCDDPGIMCLVSHQLEQGEGAGYWPLHKSLDVAGPDTFPPRALGLQIPAFSGLLPRASALTPAFSRQDEWSLRDLSREGTASRRGGSLLDR